MRKPKHISHFLVLKDLLDGVDVRAKNDVIFYYTSRIENIKNDFVKQGIEFIENISKESTYSTYKPYVLVNTSENLKKAEEVLKQLVTDDILAFLETKHNVKFSYESKGSN